VPIVAANADPSNDPSLWFVLNTPTLRIPPINCGESNDTVIASMSFVPDVRNL
jgi:hypothetical protein